MIFKSSAPIQKQRRSLTAALCLTSFPFLTLLPRKVPHDHRKTSGESKAAKQSIKGTWQKK
jgi:hypothetical protein